MTDITEQLRRAAVRPNCTMPETAEEAANEIESLRQQLETERMRLTACGVVAMANTPESAKQVRKMHPDYWSASLNDVIRAVDAEMGLHKQLSIINTAYEKSVEQHNKTLDELAAALVACERKDWLIEDAVNSPHQLLLLQDAVSVQPDASALKAHDEALIERCICVVYRNIVLTIEQKDKLVAAIRELKGTVDVPSS